jgi:hypothetical protein
MYTNMRNYYSNRNHPTQNFAEQKINYDEILKSRNEIIKQCRNPNNSLGRSNMSYESNNSGDKFGVSNILNKSRPASNSSIGSKTAPSRNMTRKSTTNLIPSRNKKPKFILKKDQTSQR